MLSVKLENWRNFNNLDDYLLNNTSTAEAKSWVKKRGSDLSQSEQEFIRKSITYRDKQRQTRIGYIVLVPVIIIFSVIAYLNKEKQEKKNC